MRVFRCNQQLWSGSVCRGRDIADLLACYVSNANANANANGQTRWPKLASIDLLVYASDSLAIYFGRTLAGNAINAAQDNGLDR